VVTRVRAARAVEPPADDRRDAKGVPALVAGAAAMTALGCGIRVRRPAAARR
jgi:hypothetical protein